jgi:kumamolisin
VTLHRRIPIVVVAAAALVPFAAVAVPAAAASAPDSSVTLFLRAPNPAGLARLAAAHDLTRQQRLARLARLVPSMTTQRAVSTSLASAGLTVSHATAWSVTAAGPASTIADLFGTRPAATASPTPAQLRAQAGPLPVVPADLAGAVALALPTSSGPAVFHHGDEVPLTGSDFRDAYTSAGTTPPGAGATDDGNATVATLQLADYSSSDLTKFAKMQDPPLPSIVGTSKYQPVTVDGGPTKSDDVGDGQVEVDLDQESILATATSATQRPYFAPNTNAGFNDVFASVFDDVTQDSHATAGGNPNIVALSSSWGGCESGYGAKEIGETETLIKALVAAGVTVFASSGDDGIYDCGDQTMTGAGNSQADVDYPASSPEVVGVGGTNLQYTGSQAQPNNGTNWKETAWSCSTPFACQSSVPETLPVLPSGTGGTGGGESGSAYDSSGKDSFAGFPAPAYQTATISSGKFSGQAKRMVPDIAADGDPNTGFELYTSDKEYVALERTGDGFLQVGGTSLSSPISAALFTNTLAAAGHQTGIGDIHGALYSAAHANGVAVRDVTSGSNGAAADKGTDPSVSAGAGYDTVSGLGGVLWPALTPYLFNTTPPTVTTKMRLPDLHSKQHPTTVTVKWDGSQGDDPIDVASTSVVISKLGSATPVHSVTAAPVKGSYTFVGAKAATYQVTVTSTDLGGMESAPVSAQLQTPKDDKAFHFHGAWQRKHGAGNIGGSHAMTKHKGAFAKVSATGTAYKLVVVEGPSRGRLGVYLGKTLVKRVNLYSAHQREKKVAIYGSASTPRAKRSFKLKCLGKKAAASHGRSVAVDGLYATY